MMPVQSGQRSEIPKLQYFKDYADEVIVAERIECTLDWRYHSTAKFVIQPRIVRIGYKRLKECFLYERYIPEWSRGTELCKNMTGNDPLLKAHWVILHELTHAKLVDFKFRDAHNKTFYSTLAKIASIHLKP